MKKWDFAIGNPAYQETMDATSDKPVYNFFMDEAYKIADKVELITPARFLFDAGKTPKAWNAKMLSDLHFKILDYKNDSSKVFPNTSITGGIVISYRDSQNEFPSIGVFTPFEEINSILAKVKCISKSWVSDVAYSPENYKFTQKMHDDYPNAASMLSDGHMYDVTTNTFEKLPDIFLASVDDDHGYVKMLGRHENQRAYRYIKQEYIKGAPNLSKYKVFIPKSDGAAGTIGNPIPARISGTPVIGKKNEGHTQTFMSIGSFDSEKEASNLHTYLKTKFARCMLGVLKVTQHNPPEKWKYVPLQDFTDNSDINWNTSISNIDKQLYKKYGLSPKEIEFIETHVKEMD